MIFLTKAKLQAKIEEAVKAQAEELDRVRIWHWQEIEALKAEVQTLKADWHERETELAREFDQKLAAERQVQEAGVQGLMQAVQSIPVPEPVAPPEPDPRVQELVAYVYGDQHRAIGELNDTVAYLLAAPTSIVTVLQGVPTSYGVIAVAEQHGTVRPMGAR